MSKKITFTKEEFIKSILKEEEGLIKTTNINHTITLINNWIKGEMDLERTKLIIKSDIENWFVYKITKETNLVELFRLVDNLGWFPAYIQYKGQSAKYSQPNLEMFLEEFGEVMVKFESKYDVKYIPENNIFYHITSDKYIDKIMKIGLVPKSKEKISSHPSRIYLLINEESINDLIDVFSYQYNIKPIVLRITIPQEKLNGIKFYNDTNFPEKGIYTESNLHPDWIEIIN